MPASLDTVVSASSHVLFQNLDGEAVLLDLESESYFGLNGVGTRVWELLGDAQPVRCLVDALSIEYEVDRKRLAEEVLALIEDLAREGLVQLRIP